MTNKKPLPLLVAIALTSPLAAVGADTLDLSLEELMQMTVTSAAKKAQSLAETAAAVFVIKADDIRRSGATNIPEVLHPGSRCAGRRHRSEQMVGQHSRLQFPFLQQASGPGGWPRHL